MKQSLETARNEYALPSHIPTAVVLVFFLTSLHRDISICGGGKHGSGNGMSIHSRTNAVCFLVKLDGHQSDLSRQHAKKTNVCSFSIQKRGKAWLAGDLVITSISIAAVLVDPHPLIVLVIGRSIQRMHHVASQAAHLIEQKRLVGAIHQTRKPLSRISSREMSNSQQIQNTIEMRPAPEIMGIFGEGVSFLRLRCPIFPGKTIRTDPYRCMGHHKQVVPK
jgi:hypothetical protein